MFAFIDPLSDHFILFIIQYIIHIIKFIIHYLQYGKTIIKVITACGNVRHGRGEYAVEDTVNDECTATGAGAVGCVCIW